ncbi:hypothetical protein H7K45_20385 [Mycobacterium yunnanensis]|uniref:Uncharacterized protein n=1 Tax=Mycobacterium yunnanensis TaxID=368477 RepID=A0A9X2Z3T2_9MYCO|nr:hypothetical protein [Mycobacterium yunnanensis]MCV7422913.1 hypothetical protein [Mycobacterium yunnanensis]
MTHFRTSATALEADAHYVRAAQLTSRPGTLPAITIPVAGRRWPDVDEIWSHLQEPAEFFGVTMPDVDALSAALGAFAATATAAWIAASVVIVETDQGSEVAVSGVAVQPWRQEPVVVAVDDSVPPAHRASDPWWRRMAARTTSRAEVDQRERWLRGLGWADVVSGGVPLLGALVVETPDGCVGVENPEPTSVLDQLAACGWTARVTAAATVPADVTRAWWVSPRFETHPVAELAGASLPFERWS